jgi:hypothetical protein
MLKKYLRKICNNNSSSQRFSAQVAQITSTEQIQFHFNQHINCNPYENGAIGFIHLEARVVRYRI